jgi:beta-glucanase (GH16 family)
MTMTRQTRVVLGALAVCAGIAACNSEGTPEEPAAIVNPVTDDAAVEPFDGIVHAEALCALAGPPAGKPGDVLVYADDFDGSAVDPKKWNVGDGYQGHGAILNTGSPANAIVRDGSLLVVTERDPKSAEYPYRSARLDSLGKFARTYGKIEFRARFPVAKGVWYALWGKPWSASFPEIDIEILNDGETKKQTYFVNHWAAPPLPANERRSFKLLEDLDYTEFHTYSILWKPDFLEFAVDGVPKMHAQKRGVPTIPVYWIMNGWVGGWGGTPDETTPFPATFEVDYVHVYRVDGLIADPVVQVTGAKTKYKRTDTIEVGLANVDEACAHVSLYDNGNLVWTTSTAPFRFPLSHLRRAGAGQHELKFAATDGARTATTAITAWIN